ncbi:MAG TPA: heavy metal-binding domain-containing protein [Pantanalinema sp.]
MTFKRNLLTLSVLAGAILLTSAPGWAAPAPQGKPAAHSHQHGKQVAGKVVVYTCPMDPDVVSDKPGRCPKCKMNLEKTEMKPASKK